MQKPKLIAFDLDGTVWSPDMYVLMLIILIELWAISLFHGCHTHIYPQTLHHRHYRYMLWGGGSPFSVVDERVELRDRKNQSVTLLGAIGAILHELKFSPQWSDTKVAWVSCTDEPGWADECLRKFKTTTNQDNFDLPVALIETADSSQIFKANKQKHFEILMNQYQIEYSEMMFFDNEAGNIRSVSVCVCRGWVLIC